MIHHLFFYEYPCVFIISLIWLMTYFESSSFSSRLIQQFTFNWFLNQLNCLLAKCRVSFLINSIASCSTVTEMVKGRSTVEAQKISQQDVLNDLGGLPSEGEHCALLAANTLKAAVDNFLKRTRMNGLWDDI